MVLKDVYFAVFLIGCISAQKHRVCISSSHVSVCQTLNRNDSQAACVPVESSVDCALKLAAGTADLGVFSEEETLLLAQMQPQDRVIATIRNVQTNDPFAFEAVTVVRSNHTGGLEGLRDSRYCHPGLSEPDLRWSPRVLKTLERLAAHTDRCPNVSTDFKTAEELEVETLSKFFSAACRPGRWSSNLTVDADLKSRFPNLCALCGDNSNCARYSINMGVNVAGVDNNNRHINALECLRTNATVAFVAWQHVRQFFTIRNPEEAPAFSILCEDGSQWPLTAEVLGNTTSPCSFIRQPWSTIVSTTVSASAVQTSIRNWWPNGTAPGGNNWQSILFGAIVGSSNARVVIEENMPSLFNYTTTVRHIPAIEATASCLPARRWCTLSDQEQSKCSWIRTSAYSLGIEPTISCQQRNNIFDCLRDIRDGRADFIATPANYGFISRHTLYVVEYVVRRDPCSVVGRNWVAVTFYYDLRDKRACFPEFGGIAYMSFVRTAHEHRAINQSQCDYVRAVGEFFSGACAGGAIDASLAISNPKTTYNASNLCTMCRPANSICGNVSEFTCAWDSTNRYFGNRGAVACLADPDTHVAFVEMQNINGHISALNLTATDYRVLCRNNTLAAFPGVNVDQSCLLAHVVDSEVLSRREDPIVNSLSALLDALDEYFGYTVFGSQLINLEMFSPFDGHSDLLFKDTVIGLSDPSTFSANEAVRNYIELFQHLQLCTSAEKSV